MGRKGESEKRALSRTGAEAERSMGKGIQQTDIAMNNESTTTKEQLEADSVVPKNIPEFTELLRQNERRNRLYDWLNDNKFITLLRNAVIESENNCEMRVLQFGPKSEHEAKIYSRWWRGLLSRKRWHSVRVHFKIRE